MSCGVCQDQLKFKNVVCFQHTKLCQDFYIFDRVHTYVVNTKTNYVLLCKNIVMITLYNSKKHITEYVWGQK